MNNLTPEPRADINGKVTTRWVRPSAQGTGKTHLPAPPKPSAPILKPVTKESVPLLAGLMEKAFIDSNIEGMTPLSAHRIEARFAKAKDGVNLEFDVLQSDFLQAMYLAGGDSGDTVESDLNSVGINNFAALGGSTGENPALLMAGLRMYDEFSGIDDFLLELGPEEQKRAEALYTVVASVGRDHLDVYEGDDEDGEADWDFDGNGYYMRLESDELANLVMDRPDRTDEIIALILERGSKDVKLIKDVLDNGDAPVLGKGVL